MARVYLDANIFIDITRDRGNKKLAEKLDQHTVYISPLSVHILFYSYKTKVPNQWADHAVSSFKIIDLTKSILKKALGGPTADLEDNIQLYSAAEAGCDVFLTSDEKLLKLHFFGKTRLSPSVASLI